MVKDCKESYLQHTVNDTSVWTWKDAVIRKSANVLHKLGFLYENISPSLWWFKEQPLLFQLPSGVKWPFSTLFLDWLLIVRLILYLSDTPHKSQCFCCGHCRVQICDEFHILSSSHYWMWKAADLSEKSIELQRRLQQIWSVNTTATSAIGYIYTYMCVSALYMYWLCFLAFR